MTLPNPNELVRIHRFAHKCYGWYLSDVEVAIVQKIARFGIRSVNLVYGGGVQKKYMYRILKQIGYAYRDCMDY